MSADQRSVTTDALATLGTIIGPGEKRDAIHLAVEPVVAGERLNPGDHITVHDGIATFMDVGYGLGIVDPFLTNSVKNGERFWFVMYPRTIHSLRHVWSHPAFTDEPGVHPPEAKSKEASEKWLREFCATSDCPSYEITIQAALGNKLDDVEGYGAAYTIDSEYLFFRGRDARGYIPAEFWDHLEIMTGRKITLRPEQFSCSC